MVNKIISFLPVLAALVVSCSMPDDRFRIEGQFKNLNQTEFYLINYAKGTKDTLHIVEGRFTYDVELTDTTTFVLMFTNFSEMPVFAQPGSLVKITGDVSHLRETEVTGTEENELMTAFRLETGELMPPEVKQKAEEYILAHPASVSSVYLLRRYFIQGTTDDYPHAYELCTTLQEAQPTNVELAQMQQQLLRLKNLRSSGPLPHFTAKDTKGNTVSDSLLNKTVNVIVAWATWNFESQNAIRQLKMVYDDHPRDLRVITVCLDASESEGHNVFARDSLTWPAICDGKMWDSPLVALLGLAFMPDNIVIDGQGNIVARSLKTTDLRSKVKGMLEK